MREFVQKKVHYSVFMQVFSLFQHFCIFTFSYFLQTLE